MSAYITPLTIFSIIIYGLIKKRDVYTPFIDGAKEGMSVTVSILPNIIGIMVAISMLRASGIIELLAQGLSPVLKYIGMPIEIIPLALLRPVSGSGSVGIVNDIIASSGPDSYSGRIACVMMGSTETTFYTLALYYGAAKIKNTRHTLKSALTADITGILGSIIVCRLFFKM